VRFPQILTRKVRIGSFSLLFSFFAFFCILIKMADTVSGSQIVETGKHQDNAKKASQAAKDLYPHEKWEPLENGIFVAKSRMPRSAEQINILEKELQQARILAERGSTVYLLPEISLPNKKHIKYPDAVVDGYIMEFKTITGSIRQVEERYKEARVKAVYVFIKIDAPLSRHEVTRKLSGYIKRKGYSGGIILAYFTQSGEFNQWTESELAANISIEQKKSGPFGPAAIRGKSDIPKTPDN
jgi:hypothetical protein